MHKTTSGLLGFALGVACVAILGAGPGQPEGEVVLPADPVERAVRLVHEGLFNRGSTLPTDPKRSLERMLMDQGEGIRRVESRLGALDEARLDSIRRRIESLGRTLGDLDVSGIDDLRRDVDSVSRAVESLSRSAAMISPSDLSDLKRTVEEIRRQLGASGDDSVRDLRDDLRDLKYTVDDVRRTVSRIEARIR